MNIFANKNNQSGAVSLFVVIFVTLLITVVTVGFIRIMIQDQRQASAVDLSKSAYDSAQAGVEDAKRALLRYQEICANGATPACNEVINQINSDSCNQAVSGLSDISLSNGEVKVQTGSSANALDQAYTCVKVTLNTPDYIGSLAAGESRLIPLKVAAGSTFNTIQLEWFSVQDLSSQGGFEVNLQSEVASRSLLPVQNAWPANRPPIVRAQFMQVGSSFTLSGFDSSSTAQSNANTLFLYPAGTTGTASQALDTRSFAGIDIRKTPIGSPTAVTCSGNISAGGYACRVRLQIPTPIGGGTNRTAYLRIGSIYNKAHFRVSMYNSSNLVNFNAVQPEVDSTGRANDLFRRVKSRIELVDTNFAYPDGAVDITGNLCKDFLVTDREEDYVAGSCTP